MIVSIAESVWGKLEDEFCAEMKLFWAIEHWSGVFSLMDDNRQPESTEERLRSLASAHLDGRIDDAEFEELQGCLASDEAARSIYTECARLDAGLREEGNSGFSEEDSIRFPITGWNALAIAAALALLAIPAAIWMGKSPQGSEAELAAQDESIPGVAVITAEACAIWAAEDDRILGEGTALEPGVYTLEEGLAQIDFFGGASISLSGPAKIQLVNRDAAILYEGRLKANVPPAARGFEIRTGEILLEDLGTSFGLAATSEGKGELVVFDGEVRATGKDGRPVMVYGGDSLQLANGETSKQEFKDAGTFPDIEDVVAGVGSHEEARYLAWNEASQELRKDPRLVAYYDFENLSAISRRLKNRAISGLGSELDGGIVGARVAEGRWGQKTALDFRSEGDRVRFQIPGRFKAITLFAWVRIDALDRRLNSLFLTDYFDENEIHWQISRDGVLHFASSPMGTVDLEKHTRRHFSVPFWEPSMSGRWFLLATTAESGGNKLTHYVNGKPLAISGGNLMEKPLPVMRIGEADLGNWSEPIWPNSSIRTLNGRIDEFGIFQEALSAEEIQQIYQQGKP
ncbi:MAG: LamG-like jellyroll fold domain-containing protein [Verrucomicrobiota bacterium]